jgi:hypothetical protein
MKFWRELVACTYMHTYMHAYIHAYINFSGGFIVTHIHTHKHTYIHTQAATSYARGYGMSVTRSGIASMFTILSKDVYGNEPSDGMYVYRCHTMYAHILMHT